MLTEAFFHEKYLHSLFGHFPSLKFSQIENKRQDFRGPMMFGVYSEGSMLKKSAKISNFGLEICLRSWKGLVEEGLEFTILRFESLSHIGTYLNFGNFGSIHHMRSRSSRHSNTYARFKWVEKLEKENNREKNAAQFQFYIIFFFCIFSLYANSQSEKYNHFCEHAYISCFFFVPYFFGAAAMYLVCHFESYPCATATREIQQLHITIYYSLTHECKLSRIEEAHCKWKHKNILIKCVGI